MDSSYHTPQFRPLEIRILNIMTKRIIALGLFTSLIAGQLVPLAHGSDRRMTPLVRAVQMAKASVVNIHSEKTSFGGDAVFDAGRGRKVNGMGTGIVIDPRGYIVTNHHVVNGVDSLRVTLDDGSTFAARVVSYDRSQDLAIIKIEASQTLTVMPIGTSSDLMLGETVFAVGNAFGYEHTVTSGIVSALSRDVEVNEKQSYSNLIQTDASINPGNSGGPLLNLDGKVVGINVAIRAGAQRIGFAIPIDDARRVIAKLLSIEQLDSTLHGVITNDVKSATEQILVVSDARPDSPAAKAGLEKGDIIVQAGQVQVHDGADFERALLGRSAGEVIDVKVRRGDETEIFKLTLDQISQSRRVSQPVDRVDTPSLSWKLLGIELQDASPHQLSEVGPRYRGGMRVSRIRKGGPGELNGIQPGDILVGLHIWETLNKDNITYVLNHRELKTFNPLKFYLVRSGETLYGHIKLP